MARLPRSWPGLGVLTRFLGITLPRQRNKVFSMAGRPVSSDGHLSRDVLPVIAVEGYRVFTPQS